ncbi:MAG: glycosyltransferase [Patescibacteria group bacterium]|nr:glycosyltransferase [Patescibacteria group bacterium]
MSVTVIIPSRNVEAEIAECLKGINRAYEVILVDNSSDDTRRIAEHLGVRIIESEELPPLARNLGAGSANGEILAFLDSDCTPFNDWIPNAMKHFEDESVGMVVGPTLTQEKDIMYQIPSLALSTFFGGGIAKNRWRKGEFHYTDEREVEGSNLFIRKSVFEQVGGFSEHFGAEEQFLADKVSKLHKIVYAPECRVYHRRTPLFRPFIGQLYFYAYGRGWLARNKGTKLFYYLPTLVVLFLATSIFLSPLLTLGLMLTYSSIGAMTSLKNTNTVKEFILMTLTFPVIHITYAFGFLRGLLARSQKKGRRK